ncbi:hypothetical protein QJ857_gp0897 [Tupanvirus soda lake]|uniref:Spore protein YkvP/CgeB glycosyl transferase-like domain-containing protein n=2 Tax=Tupanvirus TaxID=2094720 RepID=A0A6N1NKN7_9VIRU|nr:hypothetical protein QJ857_gp0897 [Tupanvirus soda lake]QKU35155.1 hypothetical protein [Tupanvirus soda lake]
MLNLVVLNNNKGIRTTKLHFYKLFECLASMQYFVIVQFSEISSKTEIEMKEIFLKLFGKLPDNIVFFEHLTEMHEMKIPSEIKINVIVDDLHHGGDIKKNRILSLTKVSRILSTYGYSFSKYYSTNVPVYFFPHSVAFDIKFNETPINKILVSGRLNPSIYPFRNHVVKLSKKNKFLQYLPVNCNYEIYKDSPDLLYGQKYVEKLSDYLACFTCDASIDRPYIVAKHFEILSSGSLLLAGNPNTKNYFEKLGFIDGMHYISVTIDNINEKIAYITNPINRETINKIRKNGYDLVREKHTFRNRANYLKDILENSTNVIRQNDGMCGGAYFMEKS